MPTYGQRPDDVVQDTKGNALQGVTISFYDSESAAEAGGASLGTATTDNRGRWRYTPATDGELWARLPDATVWQVTPARQATKAELDAEASARDAADAAEAAARASDVSTLNTAIAGKVPKGDLVFNVKDYGATGNGVTDDRTAIVNAMTAAPAGATILFPAGTYLVDAAVTITKAVTWQGQGATIAKGATTAVAGNYITANVGGVRFRDLTFTDPSSKVTGNYFTSGAAISDVWFERCTLNAAAAVVVRLARVTSGGVIDCEITACKVGVQIENDAARITVRRVGITGWKDRGVYVVGTTNAPADVLLDSVRVFGMAAGGTVRYPIMATKGAAPTKIQRLVIVDCSVEGPSKSFTAADPGTADQIAVFETEDFRICGCTSRNGGDMGITVDSNSKHGVVANNLCVGNDAAGIAIWTGCASISVSGNTLMNNGQNRNGDRTSYGRAGVRTISSSHVAIAGNTFGDDQGTKTQNYGVSMTSATNVSLGPDIDAGNALATYYKDGAGNTAIVKATTAAF